MKASLTLREDPKNPFLKAKIPLSIFGIPFCSGITRNSASVSAPRFAPAHFSSSATGRTIHADRSGDFSVRRSVESPLVNLSSPNYYKSLLIQDDKKLSWNQLFSSAYGVLADGEICARTSVTVNRAVVKLGWSMRLGDSKGGYGAEILLKDLPYLVLRKIAIEHVAGDTSGKEKKRGVCGRSGNLIC
ncbi:hypothetical protein DH2020_023449 [Rehmannia glutinosa]|uniref:Uncharacterized protein n=1 Tax=Rehmannia glutinosa TaxID=99300 RepID=A0ABR0W8Z6_REHGL